MWSIPSDTIHMLFTPVRSFSRADSHALFYVDRDAPARENWIRSPQIGYIGNMLSRTVVETA